MTMKQEDRLRRCVLTRAQQALPKEERTRDVAVYLGCSLADYLAYLEADMQEYGWTWEDHGVRFHIDHILPLQGSNVTVDMTKERLHYLNTRVYPIKLNLRKGSRNRHRY